jgi:hypothetical protein
LPSLRSQSFSRFLCAKVLAGDRNPTPHHVAHPRLPSHTTAPRGIANADL